MASKYAPFGFVFALMLTTGAAVAILSSEQAAKRPNLTLRASPMMAFAPARIVLTAELKDGPNDYEEFYCPSVEWDWGDGTKSESSADCDPYEAGKSEIKRRFAAQVVYASPGAFKVQFRLKRKDKVLTAATVTITVRGGMDSSPY